MEYAEATKDVYACPGDMHPVPHNTSAFSNEKEHLLMFQANIFPFIPFNTPEDLKMKLWSRSTKDRLETYWKLVSPERICMMTTHMPPQLTNARFIPQRTPTRDLHNATANMTAVVWMDSSILWGVDDKHDAVCYIFVDSPAIIPKRTNKIDSSGYRPIVIPPHVFHSNKVLELLGKSRISPDDLDERIRYWDNGAHKHRTYWCKLSKDPKTGHHFADLVVLEPSADCNTLSAIDSMAHYAKPFTPQSDKQGCKEHGANLQYIETMSP